ncbi:MAG: hypothetical protein K2H60_07440 [Muribaculaceae bacterium]|nr:hypothetical protein [Muribaculaceae bacterium]
MTLPNGFIEMLHSLLKEEAPLLIEALQRPPVTSVRLNSRKPGATFSDSIPVKWCANGFYLPQRPVFTLDPLLHAGAYYVQDASSMIHREVISRLVSHPITLLDLCAAPGGKTTAMIDGLPDGSRVVANEYMPKRAAILKENLTKWGYPLATVTNRDSSFFARSGDKFDIVAVDAPCSGEGMMRKDEDAVAQWSPQLIEHCATLQKEIVTNAEKALKPGGYLIYSTCTFNHIENEEIAEYIHNSLGLVPVDMEFPEEWGIPRGIDTDLPVYRFMPHRTEGEGLFLAVFRKPAEEISTDSNLPNLPQAISAKPDHKKDSAKKGSNLASKSTNIKSARKKSDSKANDAELPEIEEILSIDFDRSKYPEADIDLATALSYLRREAIRLSSDVPKGPVVITYKGLPLGMAKNIGTRANNLYPKGWRILMR